MENIIEKRPLKNYTWDCHTYIMNRQLVNPTTEEGRKKAVYIAIVLGFFSKYSIVCILRRILEIEYIYTYYADRCMDVKVFEESKVIYVSSRLVDPYIEPHVEGLDGNEWTPRNEWADHSREEKDTWVKDALILLNEDNNIKETIKKIIDIDVIFCEFEDKFGDRYKTTEVLT